jgi:hypothetical protein
MRIEAPKAILGRKDDLLDGGGSLCNASESFRNFVKGISILISWWPPRLFRYFWTLVVEEPLEELVWRTLSYYGSACGQFSTGRVFGEGSLVDAFAFDLPASDSLRGRW